MFSVAQCIYEMTIMILAALMWLWRKKRNEIHFYKHIENFRDFLLFQEKYKLQKYLQQPRLGN